MADAALVVTSTGKRKNAIARVRMTLGSGTIVVNGRALESYFPREVSRMVIHQPLEAVNSMGRFDVTCNVHGGGLSVSSEIGQGTTFRVTLPRHVHVRRELE